MHPDGQGTVQLVAGTYYVGQIAVFGFQGSFVGMGQGVTNIQARMRGCSGARGMTREEGQGIHCAWRKRDNNEPVSGAYGMLPSGISSIGSLLPRRLE
jgi:hypothetical protein